MPRNVEENMYITVGFHRHSATWLRLQREADDLDISVPHLIKLLLADRAAVLDGHGKDLWFPRGVQKLQLPSMVTTPSPMTPSSVEDDAARRAQAAAEAAQYWDD